MAKEVLKYAFVFFLFGCFALLVCNVLQLGHKQKIQLTYQDQFAVLEHDSEHHIPHISGTSDEAVYYGLGYAHANDRLWQIDLLRRLISGRLSEVSIKH